MACIPEKVHKNRFCGSRFELYSQNEVKTKIKRRFLRKDDRTTWGRWGVFECDTVAAA